MCGILGIASRTHDVFAEIYDGLLMLQHRGQDASGIVTYNGEFFREKKANGLVKDVFNARMPRPCWVRSAWVMCATRPQDRSARPRRSRSS